MATTIVSTSGADAGYNNGNEIFTIVWSQVPQAQAGAKAIELWPAYQKAVKQLVSEKAWDEWTTYTQGRSYAMSNMHADPSFWPALQLLKFAKFFHHHAKDADLSFLDSVYEI